MAAKKGGLIKPPKFGGFVGVGPKGPGDVKPLKKGGKVRSGGKGRGGSGSGGGSS